MTAEAIATLPLSGPQISRPKVHRLPALPPRHFDKAPGFPAFVRRNMANRPFLFTCSAGVATIALVVLMNGFVSMVAYHVGTLPNDPSQLTMKNAPSAILSSGFSDALASTASAGRHGETIVLKGESGSIVGQMAKLPPQNEQASGIKSMSAVDNNAGRELLSIVSKY